MVISILGIDMAKRKFDVALMVQDKFKNKVFSNDETGFSLLLEWLQKHDVVKLHACLEATSVYSDALACFLFDQGFTVSVVNPLRIKSFSTSCLMRNKTDKADAKVIAQFCSKMQPPAWQPLPLHIRQLQAMVRRLESLSDLRCQEQNRLDTADESVVPSLKAVIGFVENEAKLLKKQIRQHIDKHPDLKHDQTLLNSIPGVGEITTAQVLAFIGDVSRFKGAKQMVAFVGLNPKHHQSGSSVRGYTCISRVGSAALRKALYMPALVSIQHNPILRAFAQRLKQNGKRGKVIICAAMRKLIHIIYGVLKSAIPFDAEYELRQC